MKVPLLDLSAQYSALAGPLNEAITRVVESQRFILGPEVDGFEKAVREHLAADHAIGCASGTDALILSLRALDIEPGDEVITSPFTFFASAGAIHNVGARPVFADIDPTTFNLDPTDVADRVTDRTRVLLPVHLFGQMAPMHGFRALADEHGVALLEDGAQAIGARQRLPNGREITAGTLGDACGFSFFPSKNLGGFGDGGMVVTNSKDVADRLYRLRVHGGRQMYHHEEVGYNSRLDALQAAVLSVKLPYLESWSEARRLNARFYDACLADIEGIVTPRIAAENTSIFNQYTIRVRGGRRDERCEGLRDRGVGSAVYYPVPLHLQDCFGYLGYAKGDFPVAERAADEVLSLPVYPELTEDQMSFVGDSIREVLGR
ncbi:MAG: transcriptional regulator [Gemmatimonas sp.]|nr:transcriptional regulator [Gemmatimonas sp.]